MRALVSSDTSANRNPSAGGVVDHIAMPCFVIIPLMQVTSPVVPGCSRSTSTILASAWKL